MATFNLSLLCMKAGQLTRLTHKGLSKRDLMLNFRFTNQEIPIEIGAIKIVPADHFGDHYTVRRTA